MLMLPAALTLFSATVLQSITTLALVLLMATWSWSPQRSRVRSPLAYARARPPACARHLVEAAVEEPLDLRALEGDRLKGSPGVVVEEGQRLPAVCTRSADERAGLRGAGRLTAAGGTDCPG